MAVVPVLLMMVNCSSGVGVKLGAERRVEGGTGQVDGAGRLQLAVIRAGGGAVDDRVERRLGVEYGVAGVGQDAR